jgi:hypothetical protein
VAPPLALSFMRAVVIAMPFVHFFVTLSA